MGIPRPAASSLSGAVPTASFEAGLDRPAARLEPGGRPLECAEPARGAGRRAISRARIGDIAERFVLIVGLILFYGANERAHDALNALVVLADAMTVLLVLFRRRTGIVSLRPADWALAWAGTLGGLLMRPGGAPLAPDAVAAVLVLDGFIIQALAKLSLNRRFGIAPANRGIQERWAYRQIRHPMYFGYMLIQCGYALVNPTWYNLVVLTLTWACQFGRIHREEKFLRTDCTYRAYMARVRFRMIPYVY